jgi:anti-anti-sigma factor
MDDGDVIAVRIEESGGRRILRVDGEVCLNTAETLRSALTDALAGGREIVLDLGGVTSADLCALQLLCSAHRTFRKRGSDLTIESASERLRRAAALAGYDARTSICPYRRNDVCLWKGWEQDGRPCPEAGPVAGLGSP